MSALRDIIPFRSDPEPPPESQTITMRQAYERYKLEDLETKAENTRGRYRNALGHWERLTEDPPLAEVTRRVVTRFQNACQRDDDGRPLSKQTVDTVCRHLRAVMRSVGPRPYGEGLLEELPTWPRVGRVGKKKPKLYLEPDVRVAMYEACRVATRPAGPVPAPLWWRTLLAFLESYGWRPSDLCHGNPEWNIGLHWDDIDEGEGVIAPVLQKTGWGEEEGEFVVPITPPVSAHLDEFRRFKRAGRLFEIDEQALYRQLKKIREAAGVEQCAPYDWRDTTNTEWQRACGRGSGDAWLGHRPTSVNQRHYTADIVLLREQMEQREWLPEFCDSPANARQMTLF